MFWRYLLMGIWNASYTTCIEQEAEETGYIMASLHCKKKIDLLIEIFCNHLESTYGRINRNDLKNSFLLALTELEIQMLEEKKTLSKCEQSTLDELKNFCKSLKTECADKN